ncbi:hypothetical protein HELRODRAFT_160028 [Helobdella robusta]|uniref:Uncharacterized protein n=1 Tax=Helobdella robusta TaxID=6412 RepID=T1EPP1_HELRO|nr:hypothetical protein HELRODRAFT_160028 [Helobdella robusta]ESO05931.1 hypothetical protein HELRODRAFT_160028 [Helobdella robusta]
MSESSKVTINYFCIGAFLIFIGCVLICCLGFIIVLPFETTRLWPLVNCKVVNSSYSAHFCSCDEGFSGSYAIESEGDSLSAQDKINRTTSVANVDAMMEAQVMLVTSQISKFRNIPPSSPHLMCQSKYPCLQIFVQFQIETISKEKPVQNFLDSTDSKLPLELYSNAANESSSTDVEISNDENSSNISHTSMEQNLFDGFNSNISISNASLLFLDQGETADDAVNDEKVDRSFQIAQLYRSWDDSFYSKCSLTECSDDIWNLKENRRFKRDWGRPGDSFKCYYNPNKPRVAIIDKTPASVVLHAVLWPVLCLLAGTSLWICLCCGCCKAGDKDSNCKEKYKIVA